MRYYRSAVLAMFQSQSEKYAIRIDEFEGKVQLTDRYYREAEERNERPWISVAFGFRACKNGEWAVAAYRPDIEEASAEEQQPWVGFRIDDDSFLTNWIRALRSGSTGTSWEAGMSRRGRLQV